MEADLGFDNVRKLRRHYKNRIAELTSEIERLRKAVKLCIALHRDTVWYDVPESDVDGYIKAAEVLGGKR